MSMIRTALCAILIVGSSSAQIAAEEIVVDNLDANTISTGSWSVSSGQSPWAGQSVYNNGGNTFRWLPTIAVAGTYEVYAWWTYHSNRSSTVPYRISHAGAITEAIVNQHDSSLGGQWNLIGTVAMNVGGSHYVEVSSENGQASADAVRLVLLDSTPLPLTVATTSLADATVGVAYSETLTASGGQPPYTWSVVSGSLPAGLSLDTGSGEITGIPTAVGSETFTVGVDDDGGEHAEAVLSITALAAPTEIIVDNLDANTTFTGSWSVSSGQSPWAGQSVYNNGGNTFRWLPTIAVAGTYEVYAWWTYHSNRSSTVPYRISHAGAITEAIVNQRDSSLGGQWNLIGTVAMNVGGSHYVEVSSENGQASADAVRLVFVGDQPLSIVEETLADGVVDTPYSASLNATGGLPPYQFTLESGRLPSGVALALSGIISGDPTWGETTTFTVRVEDANLDVATQELALTMSPFVGADFGHPYLQNSTMDGITVVWWTPTDRAGLLEHGIGSFDDFVMSSPEAVSFTRPDIGSDVTRYKHEVRLSGLTAGSGYQYRVTQDEIAFVSQFQTAPAEMLTAIRFVVWADTETELASHGNLGSGAPFGYPMDQNEGIMAGVLASSTLDPDFILIAGDIVEQAGRLDDWDEFFRKVNDRNLTFYEAVPPLASRVPIFAALGNHDYYGFGFSQPGSEIHGVHKYLEHFDNPPNIVPTTIIDPDWPSELIPAVRAAQNERYFAFDYGPATVIAIDVNNQSPNGSSNDTNFNILGENDLGGGFAPDWAPGSRQYQWLEEQLQRAQARSPFTFVYWHHAAYSSGPHALPPGIDDQSGVPTRQLDELFHRYRVTAVFNGHEEMVEMSETSGDSDLGGDPSHVIRYFVPGSMGDGIRDELSSLLNPNQVFHYTDSTIGRHYGFVLVEIFADSTDPGTWKATFRQAWINPAWAGDRTLDPLGGYYDDADPAAYFEATWSPP